MAKEAANNTYKNDGECVGEIRIADDAVAYIAGIAALEVEGVASIVGNITNDVITKVGRRALSRGVAVEVENSVVSVSLALIMDYGYNIPVTGKKVKERVKNSIESMTGLDVADVSIRIAGIDTSKQG